MNAKTDIQTFLRITDWIWCVLGILFFGGIVAGLLLICLDYFHLDPPTKHPPTIENIVVMIFGVSVGAWFVWWLLNRLYWRLTEVELIGGRLGKTRLPLSSLQKIVIGLPNKFLIPGTEHLVLPQIRANSILLSFSDGSLLPMNLHGMPNGTLLMNELISRFSERVDQRYVYSDKEIKILRKADINVLIKRNGVT
jgi:hypothetical protein